MAVKLVVTTAELGSLDAALKPHYVPFKDDSGKVREGLHVLEGTGYSEGGVHIAIEDVGGLKNTLSEVKTTRDKQTQQLAAFEGLNPKEAREAIKRVAELAKGLPEDQVKQIREQIVGELKTKHDEALAAKDTEIKTQFGEIDRLARRAACVQAITEAKGSVSLLLPILLDPESPHGHVRTVKGADGKYTARVFDKNGNEKITAGKGTGEMPLVEFVGGLKNVPDLAGAFAGSGPSGGGTQSGTSPATGPHTISRTDAQDRPTYQAAAAKAKAAGVELQVVAD